MVTVRVTNSTGETIILKEGHANVYTPKCTVRSGDCHNLSVNKNATFCEYLCAVQCKDNGISGVTLTSDDCIDNAEITILKDGTKLYWEPTRARRVVWTPSDKNIGKVFKVPSWLIKLFRKDPLGNSGPSQASLSQDQDQVTTSPSQAPGTPSPSQAQVTTSPSHAPVTPSPSQVPVAISPSQAKSLNN